jgi:hypothetical protein
LRLDHPPDTERAARGALTFVCAVMRFIDSYIFRYRFLLYRCTSNSNVTIATARRALGELAFAPVALWMPSLLLRKKRLRNAILEC